MTLEILLKALTRLWIVLSVFSLANCTAVQPTATQTPRPSAVITPTPALPPTPILDSNALQQWRDENAQVSIQARFGIGAANSLAVSPDGRLIAVGSLTGIYLYQFDTLKEIRSLSAEQPVSTVEWSPSGEYLAAASGTELIVFDVSSGAEMFVLSGHQEDITSIAWSPESQKLASWGGGQQLIIWDSQTGESIRDEKISEGYGETPLHWTSENVLVMGPLGGTMISLDVNTGSQSSHVMDSDTYSYVTQVSWSSDHTKLLTGGELGEVFVWDLQSDQQLLVYNKKRDTASVDSVAWSPDGAYVAAGLRDGVIIVWNAASGGQHQKLKRKLGRNTDTVLQLDWSPDSRYLISLSRLEPITVWDVQTGEEVRSSGERTSWVLSEAWSPDGTRLATSSEDGAIVIRDAITGETLQSFQDPVGWVTSLAWSPDGNQLASGTARVTLWDVLSGEQIRLLSGHELAVYAIAWSPDGMMFASSSSEGQLFVWDALTGEQLHALQDPRGDIYGVDDVVWSPQGDWLGASYTLFTDPTTLVSQVGFWNPKTGEQITSMTGLKRLAGHPSKDIVASVDESETVILWAIDSREGTCRLGNQTNIIDLAWSPDGNLLVVSYADSTMVVFDAQRCTQVHSLAGHKDLITNVAWSPRGDLIASASWDGTVILWKVNSP